MVTHSSNIISFPNDNCDSTNLLNKEQLNSLCGAKLIKNECDASTDPSLKCLPFSSLPPGSRVIEPGQMVTMDFIEGRLNIHINADGMISKAKYG